GRAAALDLREDRGDPRLRGAPQAPALEPLRAHPMGDGPPPRLSEILEVRPASAREFELVVEILEEAAARVAARGQDGWTPGSFRDETGSGRRVLRDALDAGELFLAWT